MAELTGGTFLDQYNQQYSSISFDDAPVTEKEVKCIPTSIQSFLSNINSPTIAEFIESYDLTNYTLPNSNFSPCFNTCNYIFYNKIKCTTPNDPYKDYIFFKNNTKIVISIDNKPPFIYGYIPKDGDGYL